MKLWLKLHVCNQCFKACDFDLSFQVHSADKCTSMVVLPSEKAQIPFIVWKFQSIIMKLEESQDFDPIFVNDFLPLERKVHYENIYPLRDHRRPFPTVPYMHESVGNVESLVPSCDEILSKSVAVSQSLQVQLPHFHTRQMRREFV